MKINAIGVTTFGNKALLKQTSTVAAAAVTTAVADTFVKGISKPDSEVEDLVIAHDDIDSGCCCDYSECDD